MAASYTRFVIRTSLVRGFIVLFNIFAVASFFFIQVGSIFLIVPAAIIDVMYMLNQEKVGPRSDSIAPSHRILKLTLLIVFISLVVFSAAFLVQIYKTS